MKPNYEGYRLERHTYAPELNRLQYFESIGRALKVVAEWSAPGCYDIESAMSRLGLIEGVRPNV